MLCAFQCVIICTYVGICTAYALPIAEISNDFAKHRQRQTAIFISFHLYTQVPQKLEDYDRRLLLQKTTHLRRIHAQGAVGEMMHAVRIDLIRNVSNIAKRYGCCLLSMHCRQSSAATILVSSAALCHALINAMCCLYEA